MPKYTSYIRLNDKMRWQAALKGSEFRIDHAELDDAVDGLLMEESFACSRIPWARAEKAEAAARAAEHRGDDREAYAQQLLETVLKEVADEIRERAKQELLE